MRGIKRTLVALAILGGLGYTAYTLLLNDEAREQLKKLADLTKEEAAKFSALIEESTGSVVDDGGQPQANRQAVLQQWANIGL